MVASPGEAYMLRVSQGIEVSYSCREQAALGGNGGDLRKEAPAERIGGESARIIRFRYGAIVCLEQPEDGKWAISWILTPEMVRGRVNGRPFKDSGVPG